jgi:hypothetical protein
LEVTPPGQSDRIIMPTASSGGRRKAIARCIGDDRDEDQLRGRADGEGLRLQHDAPKVGDRQAEPQREHDDRQRERQKYSDQKLSIVIPPNRPPSCGRTIE